MSQLTYDPAKLEAVLYQLSAEALHNRSLTPWGTPSITALQYAERLEVWIKKLQDCRI